MDPEPANRRTAFQALRSVFALDEAAWIGFRCVVGASCARCVAVTLWQQARVRGGRSG